MKRADTQTNKYAQMGMAAMLPGMQYAVEVMQRSLDEMREQLNGLQKDHAPSKQRGKKHRITPEGLQRIREAQAKRWGKEVEPPVKKTNSGATSFWSKLTPRQRRNEMKRRGMIRAKTAKAKSLHAQDPDHPKHAEWLKKRKSYPSRAKAGKVAGIPSAKIERVNGAVA